MFLLVIRHAIAEDRDDFAATGSTDDDRPLTAFGKSRMRRNAEGLRRAAPQIDLLSASPLVRAHQTARIIAAEYKLKDVETVEALRPDRHPRETLSWLAKQSPDATIAVVGHEPHVGQLLGWCLAGVDEPAAVFKKGGAALVEFTAKPAGGKGRLHWLLTPAQLRILAE